MSVLSDTVPKDLARYTHDVKREVADEICEWISKQRGLESWEIVHEEVDDVTSIHPLNAETKRRLSKARTRRILLSMSLVLSGIAFGLMSITALIIVTPPYNWMLSAIILTPFAITLIRGVQYGFFEQSNKRQHM